MDKLLRHQQLPQVQVSGQKMNLSLFHHITRYLVQRHSNRLSYLMCRRNKSCIPWEASEGQNQTPHGRGPDMAAGRTTLPDADGFSFLGKKHLYPCSVACSVLEDPSLWAMAPAGYAVINPIHQEQQQALLGSAMRYQLLHYS